MVKGGVIKQRSRISLKGVSSKRKQGFGKRECHQTDIKDFINGSVIKKESKDLVKGSDIQEKAIVLLKGVSSNRKQGF